jgi:predicted ATPase
VRIRELGLQGSGLPKKIVLAPHPEDSSHNWLTILTGPNGTGKSLLLRLLTGAALAKPSFTPSMREKLSAELFPKNISIARVIALSGTTNDRFPVVSGVPLSRSPTTYDIDSYTYFGPRYASSVGSRSRAISTIAHSMLAKLANVQARYDKFSKILECLGYGPVIRFRLEADRWLSTRRATVGERMKLLATRLSKSSDSRYNGLREYLGYVESSTKKQNQIQRTLAQGHEVTIDFSKKNVSISGFQDRERVALQWMLDGSYGENSLNGREISYLIEGNLLGVDEMFFERKSALQIVKDEPYRDDWLGETWSDSSSLSSGQWHLITGLLNLTAWIEDNSLVLIDEPENSLHPEWQRSYIDFLRIALSPASSCHVIIATHSPLVAAGARSGEGNILRLNRSEDDGALTMHHEPIVYGWLPGDVLQDAFGMTSPRVPELVETANRALALVKQGSDADREMLKLCAIDLRRLSRPLPTNDPLLPALDALIALAEMGGEPNKGRTS